MLATLECGSGISLLNSLDKVQSLLLDGLDRASPKFAVSALLLYDTPFTLLMLKS